MKPQFVLNELSRHKRDHLLGVCDRMETAYQKGLAAAIATDNLLVTNGKTIDDTEARAVIHTTENHIKCLIAEKTSFEHHIKALRSAIEHNNTENIYTFSEYVGEDVQETLSSISSDSMINLIHHWLYGRELHSHHQAVTHLRLASEIHAELFHEIQYCSDTPQPMQEQLFLRLQETMRAAIPKSKALASAASANTAIASTLYDILIEDLERHSHTLDPASAEAVKVKLTEMRSDYMALLTKDTRLHSLLQTPERQMRALTAETSPSNALRVLDANEAAFEVAAKELRELNASVHRLMKRYLYSDAREDLSEELIQKVKNMTHNSSDALNNTEDALMDMRIYLIGMHQFMRNDIVKSYPGLRPDATAQPSQQSR